MIDTSEIKTCKAILKCISLPSCARLRQRLISKYKLIFPHGSDPLLLKSLVIFLRNAITPNQDRGRNSKGGKVS